MHLTDLSSAPMFLRRVAAAARPTTTLPALLLRAPPLSPTSGMLAAAATPPARAMTSYKLSYLRGRPRRRKDDKRIKQEAKLWDVKIDDLVEVNTGPEEGKRGRVLRCNLRYNEIVVDGINTYTVETMDGDANPFDPTFTAITRPRPLYFREVSLVDPQTDTRTDVTWEQRDGRAVRVSTVSGAEVPLPARPEPYWANEQYAESLCTRRADVLEVTYKPLPPYSLSKARRRALMAEAEEEEPAAPEEGPPPEGSRP